MAPLTTGRHASPFLVAVVCGLAALAVSSWILRLPFTLDDFALLDDPGGLFAEFRAIARDGEPRATFFRPVLWSVWWVFRAVYPEPVSPLPYHAFGLAVHALAVGSIAYVVARVAGTRAAWIAGALAAVCGGGLQAVAWTAAHGDALVGAGCALGCALLCAGRGRWALAALGVALFAKLSGLVGVGIVIVAARRLAAAGVVEPAAAKRFVRGAAVLTVSAVLARLVYVGGLHVAYGAPGRPFPGAAELLSGAFAAVVQGIVPIERDAAFADLAPFVNRLLGERAAWAALLPLVVLALAAIRGGKENARGMLRLVVGVFLLALPAGVMYAGLGTNHQGRHVYPALLLLCAGLGVGVEVLLVRSAWLGRVLVLLLVGLFFDGTIHVARVEVEGARVFDRSREALLSAAEEHAEMRAALGGVAERGLSVYLVRGREGPGSPLDATARAYDAALGPPFESASEAARLNVVGLADTAQLEAMLAELGLAHLDAVVFGPAPESLYPPEAQGAVRREELVLRAWTGTALGLPPDESASDIDVRIERFGERREGWSGGRLTLEAPGTAARILLLTFSPARDREIEIRPVYATPDRPHVLRLTQDGPTRIAVALKPELARGFQPLTAIELSGGAPNEAHFLDALPPCALEVEVEAVTLADIEPPAVRVHVPETARGAARIRVDLLFRPPAARWPLCADFELAGATPDADGSFAFPLATVHTDPARDGAGFPVYPWEMAVAEVLLPALGDLRVERGELSLRARVLTHSGLECARSAWVTVPYQVSSGTGGGR